MGTPEPAAAACCGRTTSGVRVLWRLDTGWPADAVEFCPVPPHRHLLVCGTYKLADGQPADVAPEACRRDGQLLLLDAGRRRLLQRLPAGALLDLKWCPARLDGAVLVAAASAAGLLLIWRLQERPPHQLLPVTQTAVTAAGRLSLALDWWLPAEAGSEARLAVSDSSGAVTLLRLAADALTVLWTARCHGHEAWTCGFSRADGNRLYTGGDDMLFRCYDTRAGAGGAAVFTSRAHEAGVTSVQSDPVTEHTVRTGSYDEHLYTWDERSLRRPVHRDRLGGGVWRIKRRRRPSGEHVLAACMYDGCHVTDLSGQLVTSFGEHKSIVYGADWCWLNGEEDGHTQLERVARETWQGDESAEGRDGGKEQEPESGASEKRGERDWRSTELDTEDSDGGPRLGAVVATCSFYDNLLCVWEL